MDFNYFNFIPDELLSIITSYFDNDTLETFFIGFLYPKDLNLDYIYYLHFNKVHPNKNGLLGYNQYYEDLSKEKINQIFEPKLSPNGKYLYIKNDSLIIENLTSIPKELYLWDNLTSIKLNNIGLRDIENIFILKNLKGLDLSNNKVNIISDKIINLSNLNLLYLSYNQIYDISENLYKLTNLRHLKINDNLLTNISNNLLNLSELNSLSIGSNPFNSYIPDNDIPFPINFSKLIILNTLHINNMDSISFKNWIFPKSLKYLVAFNCNIKNQDLMHIESMVINLIMLSIPKNPIYEITNELDKFIHLKVLNLSNCKLEKFKISRNIHLKSLILRDNLFSVFPSSICELTTLRELDLSYNNLRSISSEIFNLVNLRTLKFKANILESLNTSSLNLIRLIIDHNKLSTLVLNGNLTLLSIANNNLGNFRFLNQTPLLTDLILDKTQIKNFNFILPHITRLHDIRQLPENIKNILKY